MPLDSISFFPQGQQQSERDLRICLIGTTLHWDEHAHRAHQNKLTLHRRLQQVCEMEAVSPARAIVASTGTEVVDATVGTESTPQPVTSSSKKSTNNTSKTMKEWFQNASSDEIDAMIALQLDYRFMGDNFSSYWWIHFHALGFKHTKGTVYELPSNDRREVFVKQEQDDHDITGNLAVEDSAVHKSTTRTTYDANGLYEELDALAIPQINSAFDHMPPEQMGTLIGDDKGNTCKRIGELGHYSKESRHEIHWWRSIRDELIFRKFHKDIESAYGSGNNSSTKKSSTTQRGRNNSNNNDDDHANSSKRTWHESQERSTTNGSGHDVMIGGRTKRTRHSTEFYSDAGADLLINNTRKKKGRGSSMMRNNNKDTNTRRRQCVNNDINNNDLPDDNTNNNTTPPEFPSLLEYADTARTYNSQQLDEIEQELVDQTFEEWRFLASTNHSLLIYGVGSKKRLLDRLADHELDKDGDVVQIEGYDREITIESILQTLVDHWLGGEEPTINPLDLYQGQHDRDCTGLSYYPLLQGSGSSLIQKAALIAHELAKIVAHTLRPIYVVLHNIDGVGLRNHTAQEALATLVSQSLVPQCGLNAIRLIASIDHVNGPTLLWDTTSRYRFRWIWREAHTQRPYIDEILKSQIELDKSRNRKKMKKNKSGFIEGDDDQQLCWEESILPVLASLAARHTQALQQLAWLQLKANKNNNTNDVGVWVPYVDLLNQCRLKCVVTADNQLRNYMGELIDHGIVERSKNYGSSIITYRIPYSTVILDLIVQYTIEP